MDLGVYEDEKLSAFGKFDCLDFFTGSRYYCRFSEDEKGTSLPIFEAISISCAKLKLSLHRSFTNFRNAAALLLPPPKPAPVGIDFSIFTENFGISFPT